MHDRHLVPAKLVLPGRKASALAHTQIPPDARTTVTALAGAGKSEVRKDSQRLGYPGRLARLFQGHPMIRIGTEVFYIGWDNILRRGGIERMSTRTGRLLYRIGDAWYDHKDVDL